MKYYYGNNYNEAVGNEPVDIKSAKVLRQYQENYSVVVSDLEVAEDCCDIILECDDYELSDDHNHLKIDKGVFDGFVETAIINIALLDEEGGVYNMDDWQMVKEDDDYIYLDLFA